MPIINQFIKGFYRHIKGKFDNQWQIFPVPNDGDIRGLQERRKTILGVPHTLYKNTFFTARLPVFLSGLDGSQHYFDFPDAQLDERNLPTHLTFQVFSNRGRPFLIEAPQECVVNE